MMPVYGRRAASEGESQWILCPRASIDTASVRQMKALGLLAGKIAKALGISRASVCRALEAGQSRWGSSPQRSRCIATRFNVRNIYRWRRVAKKRASWVVDLEGSWHRSTTVAARHQCAAYRRRGFVIWIAVQQEVV